MPSRKSIWSSRMPDRNVGNGVVVWLLHDHCTAFSAHYTTYYIRSQYCACCLDLQLIFAQHPCCIVLCPIDSSMVYVAELSDRSRQVLIAGPIPSHKLSATREATACRKECVWFRSRACSRRSSSSSQLPLSSGR